MPNLHVQVGTKNVSATKKEEFEVKTTKITIEFESSVNLAAYATSQFKQWLKEHGATDIQIKLTFERGK